MFVHLSYFQNVHLYNYNFICLLVTHSVQIEESFEITLKNGYKLYSGLPSGSGIILAYILRLLDGRLPAPDPGLDAHRLVEAYKFAYGERTRLGDHMFVNASRVRTKIFTGHLTLI